MKPTYHIVAHSHWDREWYKSFEQFRAMLVEMVDDLLELLRRDDGFRSFTLDGQTVVIEDYLAVRPGKREEIAKLIGEGRIVTGPWYILPDEFLVSAESTVRNLMTGIRMAGSFGHAMTVGYIPDSFGHIAMMPAILRGFGIGTALVYRGFAASRASRPPSTGGRPRTGRGRCCSTSTGTGTARGTSTRRPTRRSSTGSPR